MPRLIYRAAALRERADIAALPRTLAGFENGFVRGAAMSKRRNFTGQTRQASEVTETLPPRAKNAANLLAFLPEAANRFVSILRERSVALSTC